VKGLSVLGSTGSIGCQSLQVVDNLFDEYRVAALVAHRNVDLLAEQAKKYRPDLIVIADDACYLRLKEALPKFAGKILSGEEGLLAAATIDSADMVVAAISGVAGLLPVLSAMEAGKDIALANKEVLVAAGHIVMHKKSELGVKILPVDSEHSAIFQCLAADEKSSVENLLLTASGGPFWQEPIEKMAGITVKEALRHPTWNMGAKITIDSATLMNKGLEIIEAHWLFDMPYEKIEVVIHPQSIIHSMVQFTDGATLAHMGYPDMKVPIQFALTWPKRKASGLPKLDFAGLKELTFSKPDEQKFPALRLAKEAGKAGGTMPTVLNGANEILVHRFLRGEIGFLDIPKGVERVLQAHVSTQNPNLSEILSADAWAREMALNF